MKVERVVGYERQMPPIDFVFIRSKVKVTGAETVISFPDDN